MERLSLPFFLKRFEASGSIKFQRPGNVPEINGRGIAIHTHYHAVSYMI